MRHFLTAVGYSVFLACSAGAQSDVFSGSSDFELVPSTQVQVNPPRTGATWNQGSDRHRQSGHSGWSRRSSYGRSYDWPWGRSVYDRDARYRSPDPAWYDERPSVFEPLPRPAVPERYALRHPLLEGITMERAEYDAARRLIHGFREGEQAAIAERSGAVRELWAAARAARAAEDVATYQMHLGDIEALRTPRPFSDDLVRALAALVPAESLDVFAANLTAESLRTGMPEPSDWRPAVEAPPA